MLCLPAGFYLSISRGRKEWIQFKYRKLPKICFNCGYLAHDSSICTRERAFSFPPIGNAVPLYGLWIKANVPIRNCFDTKRPVLLRDGEDRTANIQVIRRVQVSNEGPSTRNGTRIGGEATTTIVTDNSTKGAKEVGKNNSNYSSEGGTAGMTSGTPNFEVKEHPMNNLGPNPEDANVIVCMMARNGPDAAQVIEKPHHEICKSRTPHHHAEPIFINGPTETLEEITDKISGPILDEGKGPKEGGTKWFHDPNLPPISGSHSKKRKAAGNVSPVINLAIQLVPKIPSPLGQELNSEKGSLVPFSLGKDSPKKGSSSSRTLRGRKNVQEKYTDSFLWRGILRARNTISKGACTVLATGEDVDVWWQPWIPWLDYVQFRELMESIRSKAPSMRSVADLMYRSTRKWNLGYLRYLFGSDMGNRIGRIQINLNASTDTLIWKNSLVGNFSVKGAYWVEQQERFGEKDDLWRWIWSSKVHPRLSLLLWRVCSNVLPTGDKFSSLDANSCPLCHNVPESPLHLFTKCSLALALWFSSPWPIRIDRVMGTSMQEVIRNLCSSVDPSNRPNFINCIRVILDCIWNTRNKVLHTENYVPNVNMIRGEISSRLAELQLIVGENESRSTNHEGES
ncbi:hypothetical protein G4B88_005132 [Cannabis sativa]|uniref:Reverse transcriptase zinc-binding domain-containing protein n=1 Tax=Cannabis sativa TaxID=3483 RepID=A0A7J6ESD6_CANSA|nr:hypothetical protein G4B88_005132 [Cannabis sativa]